VATPVESNRISTCSSNAASQQAAGLRRGAPRREVAPAGRLRGTLSHGLEVAAVVGEHQAARVRHLGGVDHVSQAQLERIQPQFARRALDDAFNAVRRFGPPGAAVRAHRDRVRQDSGHVHVECADLVRSRESAQVARRDMQAPLANVGTEVRKRADPERQETARGIQGKFNVAHVVACL
jgi:hypothetical protein